MRPLQASEIVDRERYASVRPAYRDEVIAYKRRRRMSLGEKVTLLFEDRETLRFQVQEMLWVEGIRDPEKIQHELDVYNELMPGEGELSATLFVEITEPGRIRPELDALVGLDEHVALGLGDDDPEWVRARFDPGQLDDDRISAVHYLRFALDAGQRRRLRDARERARLRVDHPRYRREEEIPPALRESLVAGLTGEPEPLLRPEDARPAEEELLFRSERVRALRPADARGHVVVEPLEAVASLLDADDALVHELLAAVRRAAAELVERHGACRVHTDMGRGVTRLRWHLRAPER